MIYPSKQQTNMRYRGPVESFKRNQNIAQTAADLFRVKETLSQYREKLERIRSIQQKGDEVAFGSRTIDGEEILSKRISHLSQKISTTRGGVTDV